MRGIHDLGGLPAGAVDTDPHAPSEWEKRVDAMDNLLRASPRSFFVTDEHRRTIESLSSVQYFGLRYYERWVLAMRSLLVEKGILSEAEIEARLAEIERRRTEKS